MINALAEGLIKILNSILLKIVSIFITPINFLISALFPDFGEFLQEAGRFFSDTVITYIAFVKEVFFNITGLPRAFFSLIVLLFTSFVTFYFSWKIINFVYNLLKSIGLLH